MALLTHGQTMSSSSVAKAAEFLASVLALLLVALPLFSQGSQGTINGGVFDSTGGAIAAAKVTIVDVARGTTRSLTADEAGKYMAPSLTTGTYTVRAEAVGFRTEERTSVLVEVGSNIRVDLTLAPGEQTQTITVTGEVPAIDTTSATLGGTVSNQAILALPLNGRNFIRLLELRPGVVTIPGLSSASSSSNGRRLGADVILIEGMTQFDMAMPNNIINGAGKGSNGDASAQIPIDAIQEFNTQQNAPAEYGWRDGSVVNVGIKSGTNSLHGTAWAFGRDAEATDAANYFTKTVTPATLEQFGATAGGPILKSKLFWFVSYEGLRINIANINSVKIPSSVALPGGNPNLSLFDACNAIGRAAVNPLSAKLAGLNDSASCTISLPSNTIENVFPYNPTSSNLFYPGNPTTQPQNNGLAKVNWNLNQRNQLTGFSFFSRATQQGGGSLQPYWSTLGIENAAEVAGSWTWTPNSNWVNELRAGVAWNSGNAVMGDSNKVVSDAWPGGYSLPTGVTNPLFGGFPNLSFTSGFSTLGATAKTGQRGPQGQLTFRDAVSYLHGNHAFKFGFEHVIAIFDNSSTASTQGVLVFADLKSFLSGTPSSGNVTVGDTEQRLRTRWYAGFVQDTWRITSRLTLTPGLRYEYIGPPHEKDNLLGAFDPNTPGGFVQVGPGLTRSRLYNAEKTNFSPRLGVAWDIRGDGKTVLRAGISRLSALPATTAVAQPSPFAASRPQSGINLAGTDINQKALLNLSFMAADLAPGWNVKGPIFPTAGTAGSYCSSVALAANQPAVVCGTGAVDPNFKEPKSLQWNLDIQRAITNRLTLDVAYVGNHGYDETREIDLNAVPVGTGYTPAVINACLASAAGTAASITACKPSTAAITAARPYNTQFPWLNYIAETTYGYNSNYNALQVTVDQRAFHGLSYLVAYTYGRALDSWSVLGQGTMTPADPTNNHLLYGPSDQDIRHRFRFSPTWLIPGKKTPSWAGQMLEGWALSGGLSLQGGLPWAAVDQTKDDFVGTGENINRQVPTPNNGVFQTWNYSGPRSAFTSSNIPIPCYGMLPGCTTFTAAPADIQTACTNSALAPYSGSATLQGLALRSLRNNACYIQNGGILTPPAYGTNGNAGRNSFRGPGFQDVDLSVSKTWHVRERYSVEFRTEFFNLFNHPTIGRVYSGTNPWSDPAGGITGQFGYATTTPDASNAVLGSGGPRHIQFGLKLVF
jgi:hypothetical protein